MEMQEHFDEELVRLAGEPSDRLSVLLGVSGGIDSMCMANLFLHSRVSVSFAVAHVNFSLRGEESDGDEALVRRWCSDNGITCHVRRFDTHTYADDNAISTQMAARELRYNWFAELMKQYGYDFLSIAHNQNDSVETLFLNLLRGTGINGLFGIRRTNGHIIRPMMDFSRARIAQFVEENDIPFREDSTNRESHYSRNRLRNQVFPQFAQINPSFLNTITTSMKRFAQIGEILDREYHNREGKLFFKEGDVLLIDIPQLKAEQFRSYWLFRILDSYGFNDTHISQIEASLETQSGKTFESPTHRLVRDREYLKVYPIGIESSVRIRFRTFDIPKNYDPKCAPAGTLYIDAKKAGFPLKYRFWQAADKFRPFGMQGFKKLSDYFIDLKLDVEQKKREIVVTSTDRNGIEQIVCVAGRRIDDRYKVTTSTKKVTAITLQ